MKNDNLEPIRHSLAHLLAAAVLELYPETKPTIGPAISTGFYYDFDNLPVSEADLPKIEKKMKEILQTWNVFAGFEVNQKEARKIFAHNPYKLELIDELVKNKEKITVYYSGPDALPFTKNEIGKTSGQLVAEGFIDLCRGGHAKNPAKEIDPRAFKLDRLAGAYWRGDEKNKMLTRIYGLAFDTREELEQYEKGKEEARRRDHKKLGAELDLFFIDEKVGKGLPLWTPKGTAVKFALENLTRNLERKYGYQHIETPYLGAEELYRTSGHLDHYSHNMYAPIDMDGEKFYLRPMACPHHIRMYQRRPWSYKELPVRYAEISDYNRYEKSGELMGMIRVRKFQLTDGHLFVTPEGLKEEFKKVCQMIVEGMERLGLRDVVSYRFSKRDPENKEKYYPDDKLWNRAEKLMKEALDELKLSYIEAENEAAFYGPKLDVQGKNVNGKEDTLFTAQMDFLLPEKFNIEYTDHDGKKKRPVMIHRSTIGSLERVFGFLIEHFAGAFPFWLAPVQVKVLPVGQKQNDYASKVLSELTKHHIRAELDSSDEMLGKKVRTTKVEKVPYFIIVGAKEIELNQVTLESREGGNLGLFDIPSLIKKFETEV